MAKFYGNIGYAEQKEIRPGVWVEQIIEKPYYGDTMRNPNINITQPVSSVNSNINISHSISIVADLYAKQNSQYMRYVEFMGAKWQITNIEVQYPRLILTIGGLYNERSS